MIVDSDAIAWCSSCLNEESNLLNTFEWQSDQELVDPNTEITISYFDGDLDEPVAFDSPTDKNLLLTIPPKDQS